MIKEIPNPEENIYDYRAYKKAKINLRLKYKVSESDVSFDEEKSLLNEIAEKTGLSYDEVNEISTLFFEEIKTCMINGEFAIIKNLGKFYINGPHFDKFHNVVCPTEKSCCVPNFKATRLLRDAIAANIKASK
ncbi:MAG: HU family DNA-binding protein [Bacteroidia bacterium]